jgi:paraquat-inducible protein B
MKNNKKKLQPAMIGVFVILSLTLFMIAITLFGGALFFEKENLVIAYFDDSLKGLSVGAPVTYRGVTIGQVKEIQIQIKDSGRKDQEVIIPIIIALNVDKNVVVEKAETNKEQSVNEFLEALCQKGLRAKLKTISLLTGQRYIDLAMYEDSIAVYRHKKGKYLELPTLPSDMLQAQKLLEKMDLAELYSKVMGTFTSLDTLTSNLAQVLSLEKSNTIVNDLLLATSSLNTILNQIDDRIGPILGKVDSGINNINTTVESADRLINSLDDEIKPVASDINKTLQNMDHALLQAKQLFNQAEKTFQPNSPLYHRLNETLLQLEETSGSIKKLSNFISRNPDALIFGLQQKGEHHE